eukprot:gb/GFBE01039666.1/.p1 GENE.gb/GFBE01039666.1/~~gb/GFBE01039666.1/.p1  ORF type:complete len:155 (+),score=32.62 gb/GFBE01039666.1/:1-465(+)
MDNVPAKLLATGGMRTATTRVDKPVLYVFCGSFNSGKASLAMQISQKRSGCEVKEILHMRDNYTPEYARINPDTMAVPTLQIDDKVCTDSFDLCKYLLEHYPGPGDQEVVAAGRKAEMMAFVELVASWDEYMFTYGNISETMADTVNQIRLANL